MAYLCLFRTPECSCWRTKLVALRVFHEGGVDWETGASQDLSDILPCRRSVGPVFKRIYCSFWEGVGSIPSMVPKMWPIDSKLRCAVWKPSVNRVNYWFLQTATECQPNVRAQIRSSECHLETHPAAIEAMLGEVALLKLALGVTCDQISTVQSSLPSVEAEPKIYCTLFDGA